MSKSLLHEIFDCEGLLNLEKNWISAKANRETLVSTIQERWIMQSNAEAPHDVTHIGTTSTTRIFIWKWEVTTALAHLSCCSHRIFYCTTTAIVLSSYCAHRMFKGKQQRSTVRERQIDKKRKKKSKRAVGRWKPRAHTMCARFTSCSKTKALRQSIHRIHTFAFVSFAPALLSLFIIILLSLFCIITVRVTLQIYHVWWPWQTIWHMFF